MLRFFRRSLSLALLIMLSACVIEAPQVAVTPDAATQTAASPSAAALLTAYERALPSVVSLEVLRGIETVRAAGVIYDLDGHLITAAHVLAGATTVYVTFPDGYIVEAQIVGADAYSDVGVLRVQVDEARLFPADWGDAARVGESAAVISSPYGLAGSLAVGVISGVGRQLPSAELIDSDAPVGFQNPDILQIDIGAVSSGGALLTEGGAVVGMTTTLGGAVEGVTFAVPAATVRRVVPDLIAGGAVQYAYIGITAMREEGGLTLAGVAEPLGLPVTRGVLIRSVARGGPADAAGLRGGDRTEVVWGREICAGGDIVISVDGQFIGSMRELVTYLLRETRPGDTVMLQAIRDGQTIETEVTLTTRPTQADGGGACGG